MFNRRFFILTFMFLFVGAIFVLPNTTQFALAHQSDDHVFPEFTEDFNINLFGIEGVVTLSCVSFIPIDGEHWIPWPHRVCFPPGFGFEGPDDEGCFVVTYCGIVYECSGKICPPDDDDDDEATGGNNDDTGGNNDDTSGNNDDTSGNNG